MKASSLLLIAAPLLLAPEITTPILGVPMNVVAGSVLGTLCSLGVGKPVKPRSQMWFTVLIGIVMGCAFTSLADFLILKLAEMELLTGVKTSLGTAVSFCMRFFLPWLSEVLTKGKWVTWIPFFNRKEGE